MVEAVKRVEIAAEIEALALSTIEKADSMKVVEQTDDQTVQLEWIGENPVLVNSLSVDGILVEDYRKWCADYLTNIVKIAPPNSEYTGLPEDGGHKCVLQKIKAGVPLVSNRAMVVTYYPKDEGEDHVFMVSSRHNQHLLDANKATIGDDVVATLDVNYMRFSPKMDSCGDICGTEIKQVVITNPNGSLMDMLKTKLTKFQSKAIVMMTENIRQSKQ